MLILGISGMHVMRNSAIEMFKAYPQLKQFYSRCGVLWSRGYFVSTVGHISEATVKKYIEEQKNYE